MPFNYYLRILFEDGLMDISEKYIRMCSLAKEIQNQWTYENGDYVYDVIDGDAGTWFWYHTKDASEYIWLPRQDQLQEICINFFIHNLNISRYEAFLRFLEWYSGCLREAFEHALKNSANEFIDSGEELMFDCTMNMLHDKKWDGSKWVKSHKGYISLK
jgi:hypothetical protein